VEVFRAAHEGRPADLASPPPAVEPGFSGDDVEEFGEATVAKRDLDIALRVVQFPAIAKTLCGFPSFFAAPLFRRIKALYHLDDGDDAAGAGEDDAESTGAVDPDKGRCLRMDRPTVGPGFRVIFVLMCYVFLLLPACSLPACMFLTAGVRDVCVC